MSLKELIDFCIENQVSLKLSGDDNVAVQAPKGVLGAATVAALKEHKEELVKWLIEQKSVSYNMSLAAYLAAQKVHPEPAEVTLYASFAQQRLWFIDQLMGGASHYNMPMVLRVEGDFKVALAAQALKQIVARHEPLRTVFAQDSKGVLQVQDSDETFELIEDDLSHPNTTDAEQQQRINELAANDAQQVFDLSHDLMLRARYLRTSPHSGVLLFNMHHIASDGWSIALLVREFIQLYDGYRQGQTPHLNPLPIQYADYAHWQRHWLTGDALASEVAYWQQQLAELPAVHSLTLDAARPEYQSFNGALHHFSVSSTRLEQLKQIALDHDITLFMLLHGVFALLLSRHSNSTDIVVGSPVANRQHKDVEALIGFFVNTLVLRVDTTHGDTLTDYLQHVKTVNLGAQAHQQVPFEYLVERLNPQRSTAHSPLFQVMFSMNTNDIPTVSLPEVSFSPQVMTQVSAKFELTLNAQQSPDGLQLSFEYNTDVFKASTIERLSEHLVNLLAELDGVSEHSKVSDLTMLSKQERNYLIHELNATKKPYPNDCCIHELFEAQARQHPEAIALVYQDSALSYGELDKRANQLAHYLIEKGVKPDTLVGLCVERSLQMVIALLGILKSGGAYVPLDASYPKARLEFMLADSGVELLLTQNHLLEHLPITHQQVVVLDDEPHSTYSYEALCKQTLGLTPQHLAYVIYTSGSTGQPKGVMIEHRSVIDLVCNNDFSLANETIMLQAASFSFDATTLEVYASLLCGGKLVLYPAKHIDVANLNTFIADNDINTMWLTSGLFNQYITYCDVIPESLQYVLSGGDVISSEKLLEFFTKAKTDVVFLNGYGPTETTTFATTHRLTSWRSAQSVPLGKPMSNTQAYVLNTSKQLAPLGAKGELHIGGAGLARGYLHQDELTQEKFIANPFSDDPTDRLYKTGDIVRWVDGNLEFIGRLDNQVKVRGFRVELGEVEAGLLSCTPVQEAVVIARDEPTRLVAYVVLNDEESNNALDSDNTLDQVRTELKALLPEYMQPALLMVMPSLPLTPNGKLDRQALPAPDASQSLRAYVAPNTPTEQLLCEIWQQVLDVERVGIEDNFFELGGHSLLATQVIAALEQKGITINVRHLFSAVNLQELALLVEEVNSEVTFRVPDNVIQEGCEQIELNMLPLLEFAQVTQSELELAIARVPDGASNVQDIYPLSLVQEGILYHHMVSASDPYILSALLELNNGLRLTELIEALQFIVDRHDVLRTSVMWRELTTPLQIVQRKAAVYVDWLDLNEDVQAQMEGRCLSDNLSMDLEQGSLFKVEVAESSDGKHSYVLLKFHHIVLDHVSLEVIVGELDLYLQGRLSELGAPKPYRDFVAESLCRANNNDAGDFFTTMLADVTEPTLPFGLLDVQGDGSSIIEHKQKLAPELSMRIRAVAKKIKINPAVLFHAAWSLVLSASSGRSDVVFGTVLSGRLQNASAITGAIGMFMNTLPLRVRLDACTTSELIDQLATSLNDLLLYEQSSLALAQSCSGVVSQAPLFSALLNYRHSSEALFEQQSSKQLFSDIRVLTVQERTNYPLLLSVDDWGQEFALDVQIDNHSEVGAEQVFEYMVNALQGMLNNLETSEPVLELSVLPEQERHYLVHELNATQNPYPNDCCIHELFEAQARQHPEAIALVYQDSALSYGELDKRANQLAHYLIAKGVKPDTLVGLCVERSLQMVIALLGILKSGGAYVPLDASYPKARLEFMLADSGVELLLTQNHLIEHLPITHQQVVVLDDELYSNDNTYDVLSKQTLGLTPQHLAYVIYTSGSTGQPKGVMIEHGGTVALIDWALSVYANDELANVAFATSICFDLSIYELFCALASGNRVTILENLLDISDDKSHAQITLINTVPSAIAALLKSLKATTPKKGDNGVLSSLKTINLAGESLRQSLVDELYDWGVETVYDLYGPSEDTTYSTFVKRQYNGNASIGKPIANTQAYVLNTSKQLAPLGAKGELHIGGAGLARGYLHQDELTQEKFIANPFSDDPTDRLYKTGDIVRWVDGNLEFIGRLDNQVKVRGFRVELGEVEAGLLACTPVQEAVVIARDEPTRLVAYVVLNDEESNNALDSDNTLDQVRTELKALLPEYMQPALLMVMPSLPLTPNGKLDRQALPAPDASQSLRAYVAPNTPTEQLLCEIWQQVLDVERVGIEDNFFELGGHSLLVMRLVVQVRQSFHVELTVQNAFTAVDVRSQSALIDQLEPANLLPQIEVLDRTKVTLYASFAQQRLWFIDQLMGGASHYNMPMVLRVEGDFKVALAAQALKQIVARHEPLRTVFAQDSKGVLQVQDSDETFELIEDDLSHPNTTDAEQQHRINELAANDAQQVFDLSHDLMLRARYLRTSPHSGVLLFNMHHIASDGWSIALLVREFIQLYDGYRQGQTPHLNPLPIQYADYAHWQRHWLTGDALASEVAYWQQQLAELPAVHSLTLDAARPEYQSFNGALHHFSVSSTRLEQLKQIALDHDITLFMLLHGVFALLLSRHSNSTDIVVGSPVANRQHKDVEALIGFFVNTLVLRVDTTHGDTLTDYLQHVKTVNLGAQAHQQVPFEYLVERLNPQRSTAHSPLFQVMFSMNTNDIPTVSLPEVSFSPQVMTQVSAKFELTLNAQQSPDGLQLSFEYNTDVFKASTIERLSEHLVNLLAELDGVSEHSKVSDLTMLSKQERNYLIHELNATKKPYPNDCCIHELFEAQARQHPEAIALVYQDSALSYGELDKRANQLAHYLIEKGVKPDTLVGLCVERSLQMVIALLGILKSGGAYVPLDASYPKARLEFMLADSGVELLLTQSHLLEHLPITHQQVVVLEDELYSNDNTYDVLSKQTLGLTPQHLAYVIYTSGSTGQPKGVMIEHRSVIDLVCNNDFSLANETIMLQAASFSFDATTLEVYVSLLCGGKLVLYPAKHIDVANLNTFIADNDINTMWLTSGLFNQYITYCDVIPESLQYVLSGGDVISSEKLLEFFTKAKTDVVFLNGYGPTETTTFATTHRLTSWRSAQSVPLGKPIANTQAYVLNTSKQLAPLGAKGELHIGGAGLARGYLHQDELTQEKFIANPFSDDPTDRLYKTGDIVRWVEGNLEFIGRLDNQVKVRGFRVELGEVEAGLLSCTPVQEAVVIARDEPTRLVAYVVLNDEESNNTLDQVRTELKALLPEYMQPALLMVMPSLPLTPNGKLDRQALPAPDASQSLRAYVAPNTPTEQLLCEIWQQVLDVERVGIEDNFFELGGHSLLVMRLVVQVRQSFHVELTVQNAFTAVNVRSQSALIDQLEPVNLLPQIEVLDRTKVTLYASFAQQRLWFIDQLMGGASHYNMPMVLRVEGDFKVALAAQALKQIVARHEPLRTVFAQDSQGVLQVQDSGETFELIEDDLSHPNTTDAEQQQRINELAANDAQQVFDLSHDLMLRARYLRTSPHSGVLLFNMHHIASDGWSIALLVREFIQLYDGYRQGQTPHLNPLPIQYADYAHWQRHWLTGDALASEVAYWQQQLAELPAVHSLTLDAARPEYQSFNGALHHFSVSSTRLEQLKQIALDHDITLFMLLHGVFALLLSRHSNSTDIVVGSPVANRQHKDVEALIGFFVNTLVLRVDTTHGDTLTDYLQHVKTVNLGAQAHQQVPFEYLVERLNPQRSTAHSPLFQVMFSMNTNDIPTVSLPEVSFSPQVMTQVSAKFELTLNAQQSPDGLQLSFEYNTDVFKASTIERLSEHLVNLLAELDGVTEHSKVSDLTMLSKQERNYLIHELNATQTPYPNDCCIHELFEAQARQHPEAIALVYQDSALSYGELDKRANQLAHYLIAKGVKPDTLVGLCVEPSFELIIGMLAIFKLHGIYLPLDPNYPPARLSYMLSDSNVTFVLTKNALFAKAHIQNLWPAKQGVFCLDDDGLLNELNAQSDAGLSPLKGANSDAAYLLYTSGSTGEPKGVLGLHSSLLNRIAWMSQNYAYASEEVLCQKTSINFVDHLAEIFQPLSSGQKLVVVAQHQRTDLSLFIELLVSESISRVTLVPSLLKEMLASDRVARLNQLRYFICSGEALDYKLVKQCHQKLPQVSIINLYGATESGADCTYYAVAKGAHDMRVSQDWSADIIPIGKPIANTQAYVLNTSKQLAPLGAKGELHIGGAGLARGYLHQDELTQEKFIANPFSDDPTDRLYKTGDIVRWVEGNLEFIGRLDNQVKVRGFRVELGEVEAGLLSCTPVQEAVVIARDEPTRLVAYVVLNDEESNNTLDQVRTELKALLPEYMQPALLMVMPSLPLTPNGKLDRQALPAPDASQSLRAYVAPNTPTEQLLCEIWQQVLDVERVGIEDNFFELGGHSLLVMRLVVQVRQSFHVELTVQNAFTAVNVRSQSALIDQLEPVNLLPQIEVLDRTKVTLYASFAQQRLWFIDQLMGGASHYNMPMVLRVEGDFKVALAAQALKQIVARHEPLRTVFAQDSQGVLQVQDSGETFELIEDDLSHPNTTDAEQQQRINELAANDAQQVFDLSHDLMLRARYLRTSPHSGVLLFNMHHIASDGWSIALLVREFIQLYDGYRQGQTPHLNPLPIQYADYAHWQRHWLTGDALASEVAYWQQQLAELPAVHSLTLDAARPEYQSFNGALHHFSVSSTRLEQLKQIALDHDITLFMLLHGVFALLLSRHSNSTDIVVGSPVANRQHKDVEALIGFFVNTLVLRVDTTHGDTLTDYLQHVKTVNLGAQAHQQVPFEYLVERLNPQRSTAHSPLFQVMFSMNTNDIPTVSLPEVSFSPQVMTQVSAKFELTLNAQQSPDGLQLSFEYNTDVFKASTIERLSEHLVNLLAELDGVTEHSKVSDLTMLSKQERHYLIHELNATKKPYPNDCCIHELFEAQARQHPEAIALVYQDSALSYGELDKRANQLAHYLIAKGVKPDTLVGLCVERSLQMVIALLGILKSGGAYVPLDASYPKARLEFMLADSGVELLLTQNHLLEHLPITHQQVVVLDDEPHSTYSGEALCKQTLGLTPQHLAYVIYTSGSTGQPKGVMLEHGGAVNLAYVQREQFHLNRQSRVLHFASISFDAASWEWMMGLLNGATLYMASENEKQSASQLSAYLLDKQITHATLPPALLSNMTLHEHYALEAIVVAGESINKDLATVWSKYYQLFNGYGPTENTICASIGRLTLNQDQNIHIGTAIANVNLLVLGTSNELAPLGAKGELHIGGAGLARGYLHQDELTQEKFIANPFSDDPTDRLYKTGDIVRWVDGNLEFIGRLDNQVKVRGFRVELGEVEAGLLSCTPVQEAVVIARDEPTRLVAYVVLNDEESNNTLDQVRTDLKALLPEYMQPALLMVMPSLPLTPNGKLDRQALPAPDASQSLRAYVAPNTPTEQLLCEIWQQVLDVERVGVNDNFFELGGHSLSVMQVMALLNGRIKNLSPVIIFKYQTIAQIAQNIDLLTSLKRTNPIKLNDVEEGIPLFIIHDISGLLTPSMSLVQKIDTKYPLYGFEAAGNIDLAIDGVSIQALAEKYIRDIKAVSPQGPYRLLGWSFGGVLAYEIAHQLAQLGDEIEFIGLLDSHLRNTASEVDENAFYRYLAAYVADESLLDKLATVRELVPYHVNVPLIDQDQQQYIDDTLFARPVSALINTFHAFVIAHERYSAAHVNSCAAHLFAATSSDDNNIVNWQKLLGNNLIVTTINGTHHRIMSEPNVNHLATQIMHELALLEARHLK